MHPEDFQIFLKLADGSFHPLVAANGKRRVKLMITTAHRQQDKAVFEFYARTQKDGISMSPSDPVAEGNRVASLELELGSSPDQGHRDLALSVELDLFDNLSLSVADPVSGALRTAEVSLSEWLMLNESDTQPENITARRGLTPLKVVLLVLFVIVCVGVILLGTWLLATRFSVPPPPSLTGSLPSCVMGHLL